MLFANTITQFWSNFTGTIVTFSIFDLLDILAVTLIIYYGLKLIRETRAVQFIKSIGVIFAIYFIADLPFMETYTMNTLKFIIGNVVDSGLVVIAVLFQPEIRRALERIGRSKISDINPFHSSAQYNEDKIHELIEILCKSCGQLSANRTGALIVIEREIRLGDIISTGTVIDAAPCEELIGNLFFINSPLHDGAMIIRDSRIHAVGCFLPLSESQDVSRNLGTRHRAALGMSEVSDAVIIVVSEETGKISVAADSGIQRGLSVQNLEKFLTFKLASPAHDKRLRFGRKHEKPEKA